MLEGAPLLRASSSQCTHLLAVVGRVHPIVQAGFVRQPEDLLEQVLGEVLAGVSEDKMAHPCVLIVAVVAEVDKVLDVIVGPNVLDLLNKTDAPE